MSYLDTDLNAIITHGKQQGYLTYDEVNAYLPDEDVNPEKLDNLLIALDEGGIQLVESPPKSLFEDQRPDLMNAEMPVDDTEAPDALGPPPPEEIRKLDSDPIRMYLSQMAHIPLTHFFFRLTFARVKAAWASGLYNTFQIFRIHSGSPYLSDHDARSEIGQYGGRS